MKVMTDRRRTLISILLALGVLLATPALAAAAEWVLLDENQGSNFFFDKSGVTKPKPGVLRVKTRVVYTEEGKDEALKTLASPKGMESLHESRYVYDLDCTGEESRLLEVVHLDRKGTVLKTSDLSGYTDWESIPSEARLALVEDIVCPDLQKPGD